MWPRVLFVSKPIVAPFHDGTKCLVRDLARELVRHQAIVMGAEGHGRGPFEADPEREGRPRIRVEPVYAGAGAFAPALADNARAAAWLLLRSRAELWHFVFAPNPRSSLVGRVAKALRRVPVVQTVASPPADYAPEIFFGDVVVAQSRFTRDRILASFASRGLAPPDVRVVPPPLGDHPPPSREAVERVRSELSLAGASAVFVYPGDLEVSRGADTVARAVPAILRAVPGAVVVFACRPKTKEAPRIEAELRTRLAGHDVRFVREVDLRALLALSTAVLFPVDDLRGKVDLPISLLEAMQLGVPVVAPDEGPLADLDGAIRVPSNDPAALASIAAALAPPPPTAAADRTKTHPTAAAARSAAAHAAAAAADRAKTHPTAAAARSAAAHAAAAAADRAKTHPTAAAARSAAAHDTAARSAAAHIAYEAIYDDLLREPRQRR